jgi:CubicO group peptidase (beta-lactamase class C family)
MTNSMPTGNTVPADWQQQFSDFVTALQQRRNIPGIAVTVFDGNSTLFEAGFGHRNLEADLPATPDTIFGIASVTKSLTCLAVLQLASRGKLELDDPISNYLPEFDLWDSAAPATIRHFMNQTSGLPALPTLVHAMAAARPEPAADLPDLGTYGKLAGYVNAQSTLLAAPGELFCYQNDAYGLLGAVIEQAAGVPYTDYMAKNIFAPLGMTRTTFDLDTVLADSNATTPYAPAEGGGLEVTGWDEAPAMTACGFLRSTARDLQKYVQFLLGATPGNVLGVDAELLAEMRSPQVPYAPGAWYGFGLRVQPDHHGVTLIGHSGGLSGVSSHIGFIPELGIGAAVLTNLEDIPASMIWLAAMNTLRGLPAGTPQYDPAEYRPAAAELQAVLGSYRSGEPWGRTELFLDDSGALRARTGDPAEEYAAFFAGPDELAIRGEEQLSGVLILRHGDGSVRGLHQGSRVLLRV